MYIKHNIVRGHIFYNVSERERLILALVRSPYFLCYSFNNEEELIVNQNFLKHIEYKQLGIVNNILKNPIPEDCLIKSQSIDQYIYEMELDLELFDFYYKDLEYKRNDTIHIILGEQCLFLECAPWEKELEEYAENSYEHYKTVNNSYLLSRVETFELSMMLIPVRIEDNREKLKSFIRMDIHKDGIITVTLFIEENSENLNLLQNTPRLKKFDKVTHYLLDTKESVESPIIYLKEEYIENMTLDDILDHYLKSIIEYFGNYNLSYLSQLNTVSWGIGKFDKKKDIVVEELIKEKSGVIGQHLFNARKELTGEFIPDKKGRIEKKEVFSATNIKFYVTEDITVFLYGHPQKWLEIPRDNEHEYKSLASEIFQKQHFETLNFFELNNLRKVYFRELLIKLNYHRDDIEDKYSEYLEEITNLSILYHPSLLFLSGGTPKETYNKIEENLSIKELQDDIETFLKNVRGEMEYKQKITEERLEILKAFILAIIALIGVYQFSPKMSLLLLILFIVISVVQFIKK